ncbi:hypothetical protein C8J57DRAFT_1254516 [Mycena rebaudengoi]|nr:hypothetical protein C8J57DRAFT_1254516 [Mycena rebaudengoi]
MVRPVGSKSQRKAVEEQKREEKITEAVTLVDSDDELRQELLDRLDGKLPEIIPNESDDDPSDKENASPVTGAKRKAQEADSDFYPSGRPKRRAVGPNRLCL